LPGLRFAGEKTKSRCHYQTNRINSETRAGESACAIGQGSKRFSHRSRALGGTPGFDTLYVDGKLVPISHFRKLERFKEHTIDVVIGLIDRKRIAETRDVVRRALEIGHGTGRLLDSKNKLTVVSTEMSCPNCGRAFEELDPRLFSFNSPHGACEECGGFGEIWDQDLQTAASPNGESVLETELAAERESEWIEEGEARECPSCHGSRLNGVARHVRVQGYTIDRSQIFRPAKQHAKSRD
jgi:excinuclease ABC subunit A